MGQEIKVIIMVERQGAYRVLLGNPERGNSLGKPKHLW
jgi:hypothetical protein